MPSYIEEPAIYYSGYFYEDVFERLAFKPMDLEEKRLLYIIWVGLLQSVEGLKRVTTLKLEANYSAWWPLDLDYKIWSSLGLQPATPSSRF